MRRTMFFLLALAVLATGFFWYENNIKSTNVNPVGLSEFSKIAKEKKEVSTGKNFAENNTDEEAVGFIKTIFQKGGKNYLNIDYVEFLIGKYALIAMIQDGKCMRDVKNKQALIKEVEAMNSGESNGKFIECAPYDYYMRNKNSKIRTFEISDKVKITRTTVFSDGIPGNKTITLEELKIGFPKFETHFKDLPFQIKLK